MIGEIQNYSIERKDSNEITTKENIPRSYFFLTIM